MKSQTRGYYSWIGNTQKWHRTLKGAELRAIKGQSFGIHVQIDCCKCNREVHTRCICNQED